MDGKPERVRERERANHSVEPANKWDTSETLF